MENVRHFNAFISYRHNPTDSAAASRIQRYLEHFRVPRAIAKRTGKKKIERIFRDKEELPITSDLGDTITMALRESDFLIVICSPRTQESLWVKREIRTFLETHSARQVLTVLVEGEPQDIIPPELLTDNETGEPLEPLSCDWRLPLRRAKREELPRLAAAILGCAYDELRRRQRQYVMRRVTAGASLAFALMLAFGVYMIRTNMLIRENYENALRSQSEYLAEESLALLNGGDRLSAILLAMEGLPGPGGDRPLVTRAEYALSSAVGAYETGTNAQLVALGALTPEGAPTALEIDKPGRRALILDDTNTVSVWSIETMERLYALRPQEAVRELLAADDSRFYLLLEEAGIVCYDTATGEELWSADGDIRDAACAQGKVLTLLQDDGAGAAYLRLLSEEDGNIVYEIKVPKMNGTDLLTVTPYVAVSPGGRYIAVGLLSGFVYPLIPDFWYVVDTSGGEGRFVFLPEEADLHFDHVLTDGGKLITVEFMGDWSTGSLTVDVDRGQSLQTGATDFRIYCLDCASGELIWSHEVTCYQITWEDHTLCPLRSGNIAVVLANVVEVYDADTGEVESHGQMQSSVLTCADLLDDRLHVVTEDGGVGQFRYDRQMGFVNRNFQDGLRLAGITVVDDGYLRYLTCREGSGEVLVYGSQAVDPGWEVFENDSDGSISTWERRGDRMVVTMYDGTVQCLDLTERRLLWETNIYTPPDGESGSGSDRTYRILDWDTEADLLLVWQRETWDEADRFATVRASDGTLISSVELPTGTDSEYADILRVSAGPGGTAVYCMYDTLDPAGAAVCIYDPASRSLTRLPVWEDGREISSLWPNGDLALAVDEDGGCALLSLSDGTVTPIEGKLTYESSYSTMEARRCAWSGDGGRVAAAGEEFIYVWSRDGELLLTIPWVRTTLSLAFAPDGALWVMGLDGALTVFSPEGTETGRVQCEMYGNPSGTMRVEWLFTQGDVYVVTGAILTAVDPEAMAIRFTAWEALTLDEVNGRVVALGEDGIMSRPLYTVEELVERGCALTGTLSLTPTQRAAYGLD